MKNELFVSIRLNIDVDAEVVVQATVGEREQTSSYYEIYDVVLRYDTDV